MNYLIKNAIIFDKNTAYHLMHQSLLVQDGIIKVIANNIPNLPTDIKIIAGKKLGVSTGWVDMRCSTGESGYEHKETLESTLKAALYGGFTTIALLPNLFPIISTKNDLAFLLQKNKDSIVKIYPIAAATQQTEGKELTEMIDLHKHGAVAFSDGIYPLNHTAVLLRAMQYLQPLDALLMNRAEDFALAQQGQMHEGIHSTYLGMKGIPALAEELMVQKMLSLLEYAGGRLHISLVSTQNAIALIRQAKQKGLQISCDVAIHHLIFDDSYLQNFDTNYKVSPPLRSPEHIQALWQGLADGTIDAIVSDHQPQDLESKNVEFNIAQTGIIGLQTLLAALLTHNQQHALVPTDTLIEKLTTQPRKILKIPQPSIAEGEVANLTIFEQDTLWTFTQEMLASTAQNSPFIGHTFTAKPVAVFHNKQHWVA